ncbi:LPS assembly protein LptD [Candidatus Enterovibrio escicola]|uniref:LPS assembly protein LptD n=1 Tax=Candidatus Enterovibrio escicola TaxID=1927127 RepID=UPI001237A368|nr:LPS assembly protein LptD [Candidatus Enterovibrio escacola]
MSLTARSFLSSMIYLALHAEAFAERNTVAQYSQKSLVIPTGVCLTSEYCYLDKKEQVDDVHNTPVIIVSDHAEAKANVKAIYRGDVVVTQGHRTIKADVATLRQPENIITAEENVYFYDGEISVYGKSLESNLDTKETTVFDAEYSMMCMQGRGKAKRLLKKGTISYELEAGNYTTCPNNDNSWRLSAGKIEKKANEIFATLYHAKFEILDTPIFYLPYLRVPVESGRLTGFLYPSVHLNNKDGFTLITPFYWSIDPKHDMLITPKYMSKRGLFTRVEPRYLTDVGKGSMVFEYIGKDNFFSDLDRSWGVNWKHSGLKEHWKYDSNYSKVSEIGYFSRHNDSRVGKREDNTLLQTGEVSYRDNHWDGTLSVRNFQALSNTASVYRILPQISFNYYPPITEDGFDFTIPSQISNFATDDDSKPDSTRIHVEPTFTLPYNLPWLNATAEGKVLYTYYAQRNIKSIESINGTKLEATVSRVVPMTRLHAGVTLEKDTRIWDSTYTQTFEPQMQYLFLKKVDQSSIYNPVDYTVGGYDTARLQTDYYGLFRSNQFSSVDYINPANQFTLGATSRFFDDAYKERFNIAFGQIYYLARYNNQNDTSIAYSAWAVESESNLNDKLFIRGSVEYNSYLNKVQFGNATLEYRNGHFFAQTSYRYVAKSYIASTIMPDNIKLITKEGISQAGFITGFPLGKGTSLQGQYFHDLTQDKMLENQFGITYTASCWTIGLSYNEYQRARININDPTKYANNITLSFSLFGLGAGANTKFRFRAPNRNMLGYRNPFGLNN